jgi:DMSO/TMAO reductase YedYZ molybdopterin-dependent catalytic subunit
MGRGEDERHPRDVQARDSGAVCRLSCVSSSEYAPLAYYEILTLEDVSDPQTILAYEMNWNPLPIPHGAFYRLRVETKTGYKKVKYLRAIELVETFSAIGG